MVMRLVKSPNLVKMRSLSSLAIIFSSGVTKSLRALTRCPRLCRETTTRS